MTAATPDLTPDHATFAANLKRATGGAAPHHAWRLMCELADASGPGGEADEADEAGESRVVAAIETALALAPRDPLEAMLVAQMAAVHAAAMRALRRAAECTDHPQIEALYLRTASRLLHLFVRQSEALDRRARKSGRPAERTEAAVAEPEDDPEVAEILEMALDAVRKDLGLPTPAKRWDGKPKGVTGAGKVPRPPAADRRRTGRPRQPGSPRRPAS